MAKTKCLVLGSCTGQKNDQGCPGLLMLQETDFRTNSSLVKAEQRAKQWLKPSVQMYTGTQHKLMMKGVNRFREGFAKADFDVSILSAGYGLISEKRLISPYNITFKGKPLAWIRERSAALNVPSMTRELIKKYQVVFFLLGKEYLNSLDSPPEPARGQKFVFFGKDIERFRLKEQNVVIIPAAQPESKLYRGAGVTGIKGRMFDLFAQGMTANANQWESFLSQYNSKELLGLIRQAMIAEKRETP